MFFRLRLAVVLGGALLVTVAASADEPVYRVRTAEGRDLYTNAGALQVGGERPTALTLPELANADFAGASAEQLQTLDRGVAKAHEELQSGEHCEAIRASSRIPMRSFFLREQLREVAVASALCVVALLALVAAGGRLRRLMPIPPLLGALYVGFVTYTRVDDRLSLLREGLRACSSELPEGQNTSPDAVKQRLESAMSLQAMVDRAYAERSGQVEQIMSER
jgi:hypothetical protein